MKKYLILSACCMLTLSVLFSGCLSSVNLGEYKGLEITVTKTAVTDEEIEEILIADVSANSPTVEITDRPVQTGDVVNIDYSGSVDGEKFDGGTDTGYDLEIGSGQFIPGFEDALIGMTLGETGDINVTFPDPYSGNSELSGKEAVFTITINKITVSEIPEEITDDVIKELFSGYQTVAEYKESIRSELELEAEENDLANVQQKVWEAVNENTEVKNPPQKKTLYYRDLYVTNNEMNASYYGMTLDDLIEYSGMTREEFDEEALLIGEDESIRCVIVDAIAKKENITVSDEELQSAYDEYQYTEEQIKDYGEALKDDLLFNKVLELLVSEANVTYE